ncbi:hypothetical protein B484DRAFT_85935 [Ochromonadaceae sp. CCMP2298]|nr:hypothetical protein B484DRAFT_85935 [Ochromonadaceae sp. CCMP2298]
MSSLSDSTLCYLVSAPKGEERKTSSFMYNTQYAICNMHQFMHPLPAFRWSSCPLSPLHSYTPTLLHSYTPVPPTLKPVLQTPPALSNPPR